MAKFVLNDAEVTINGEDLSAYVMRATLNTSVDLQESTTMSSAKVKTRLSGLKDWSLEVQLTQDFDSGSVDSTLYAIEAAGSPVTVTAMANKTAGIGVNNPKYSGSAVLASYNPLSNAVGELATVTVTFNAAGALSRLTTE